MRQAISVVKKRSGAHERTIRELRLERRRASGVGEPLDEFHGVLTGVPEYAGAREPLLDERRDETAALTAARRARAGARARRAATRALAVAAPGASGPATPSTCADAAELLPRSSEGAGGALIAEEALHARISTRLAALLAPPAPLVGLPADRLHAARRVEHRDRPRSRRSPRSATSPSLERPVASADAAQRGASGAARPPPPVRGARPLRQRGARRRSSATSSWPCSATSCATRSARIRNASKLLDAMRQRAAACRRRCAIIDRQTAPPGPLVDDLLDVSRVTSGKIALQRQAVDLAALAPEPRRRGRPQRPGAPPAARARRRQLPGDGRWATRCGSSRWSTTC